MIEFMVFGVGVYLLSILIAYGKSHENKKKLFFQMAVVVILLVVWLILAITKQYMFNTGLNVDRLTVKTAGGIELVVNIIYPFIIGPVIAMLFAIFKVVK